MKWLKKKFPYVAIGKLAIYSVSENGDTEIYWHGGKPPLPGGKPGHDYLRRARLENYKIAIAICEAIDGESR